MNNEDITDITELLRNALTPDAQIHLNACQTAQGKDNLTKSVSEALPGKNVFGLSTYASGPAGGFIGGWSPGSWFEGLWEGEVLGWHVRYVNGEKQW